MSTLDRVTQCLPRDLHPLLWHYIEPVYPCNYCDTLVAWSTIISWGQGTDPDTFRYGVVVWCSEACLLASHKRRGVDEISIFTWSGKCDHFCVPCYHRSEHKHGKPRYWQYPQTPCTRMNDCPAEAPV
jgi:hypothetical protein